ncbi:MAG: hypothetical protein AB7V39_10900 [Nitrospiraceae bacterium]
MTKHHPFAFIVLPLWTYGLCTMLLISSSLMLLACNAEEKINDYFGQMGLTRLAVLQTDVQPGSIILMKGAEAFLADHILDYVDLQADAQHDYGIFGGSAKDDVNAVLRRVVEAGQLSGTIAATFLASVFRLGPSLNLSLADTVSIDIPDARVRKIKVASLERFLTREDSGAFQAKVHEWTDRGLIAYVVYEVYRAKSIKVSAAQGTDVAPSLKADAAPQPIGGELAVTYKKVAANELVVAGNRYYAFAVRTAKLEITKVGMVQVDRTDFVKPKEWGIKSAGTDDQYAAPLIAGFKPVTMASGLPPDL